MLLLIFSDWNCSLFVKPIKTPHFNVGSSHRGWLMIIKKMDLKKMNLKKMSLLKKPLNPFSVIFWAFIVVVFAVMGLFFKWKKAKR